MRVDVLQALAICCYGNAFLSGAMEGRAPELLGCNSVFRSASDLVFERASVMKIISNGSLAEGTAPWFRRLQSEGVESLRLCLERCAYTGQPEEEGWGILTDGDVGLEIWQPSAKTKFARYGELHLAKVTYTSNRFSRWALVEPETLESAGTELMRALEEGLELCRLFGLDDISEWLLKCLVYQRSGEATCPGFTDLFPPTMPLEQQIVSAAAVRTLLVLSSAAWTEASASEGAGNAFHSMTARLWKCALKGFETSALKMANAA